VIHPHKQGHSRPTGSCGDRQVRPRIDSPLRWAPDDRRRLRIRASGWIQPQLPLKVRLCHRCPACIRLVNHAWCHRHSLVNATSKRHPIRQHPQRWRSPVGVDRCPEIHTSGQNKILPARWDLHPPAFKVTIRESVKPAVLSQVARLEAGISGTSRSKSGTKVHHHQRPGQPPPTPLYEIGSVLCSHALPILTFHASAAQYSRVDSKSQSRPQWI
jgi:hypothetical protein